MKYRYLLSAIMAVLLLSSCRTQATGAASALRTTGAAYTPILTEPADLPDAASAASSSRLVWYTLGNASFASPVWAIQEGKASSDAITLHGDGTYAKLTHVILPEKEDNEAFAARFLQEYLSAESADTMPEVSAQSAVTLNGQSWQWIKFTVVAEEDTPIFTEAYLHTQGTEGYIALFTYAGVEIDGTRDIILASLRIE